MEREKDKLLAVHEELLTSVRTSAARDVALAKHDRDFACGVLDARGLFESSLAEIVRTLVSCGRGPAPPTVSGQLEWLFSGKCPELVAYLKVAAADNQKIEKLVLKQARKLFDVLSERPHSGSLGSTGAPVRLPVEAFKSSGESTLLAFAAFLAFSGRDLRLYDFVGDDVAVTLRAPAAVLDAVII